MRSTFTHFLITFCWLPFLTNAQPPDISNKNLSLKKTYFTKPIEGDVPAIDGVLDDPIWETVAWGGDFIQYQPYEGEAPTQKTGFKILYDEKNLYIAYRCYDTEPDKIVKRLSRRDGFEGDWIEINIDSYHDLRTAFSFSISAAGVKGDEFISNDGKNWDSSWDPIWYGKTKIDDEGWAAEVRIPLSQLRFANKEAHVWGIQLTRRDFRKEERSVWQYISRNQSIWVSGFGELHGLVGIKSQKQLEIQPYVVAQAETFKVEEGNPYATGNKQGINLGLDGKIGVTSDMTIDFTINPDFGQVEADPSALALDGYQIFFEERRPFFIEGRNIFDYRITPSEAGGPFGSDILFYSRRIGGAPHGYPEIEDHEFMNSPENTTILGAVKFSGKTKKGLSIGIIESITQREFAKIHNGEKERKEIVEPLTNYFVGRLQQDFREGNTVIGGMFTATNRKIDDIGLNFLHSSAYSGGLDFLHRWANQMWYVSGNAIFSKVNGSTEAITKTQERFEHNFQRVDADYLSVDTTATSLLGHGGTFKLGKVGGGKNFNFEGGVTWRSPELELNDVGFLRSTDEIIHFLWAGYRINKPFSIFRMMRFNYNHWLAWDFSGLNTFKGTNINAHATFKNNYSVGTGGNFVPYDISSKTLRGGPNLRLGKTINNWTYLESDNRKKIQYGFNLFHQWGIDNDGTYKSYSVWGSYRPTDAIRFSISPSYDINHDVLQFVENAELENGEVRYLNGTVDQKTFSVTIRLNYTINPNLSIQYYGSPFISQGEFSSFKHITNSMDVDFDNRFIKYKTDQYQYDPEKNRYDFDEEQDDKIDFSIENPDFSFMQFRSNLVVRWEYIPGSEIFFVWSQGTTNTGDTNQGLFPNLEQNLFSEKAHNIFLIKYTYRFIK